MEKLTITEKINKKIEDDSKYVFSVKSSFRIIKLAKKLKIDEILKISQDKDMDDEERGGVLINAILENTDDQALEEFIKLVCEVALIDYDEFMKVDLFDVGLPLIKDIFTKSNFLGKFKKVSS